MLAALDTPIWRRKDMNPHIPRRNFLGLAVIGAAGSTFRLAPTFLWTARAENKSFPRQDVALVEEMVRVAHSDLARVKQLVDAHPALAKASIDWGYGDWEDALGAASHTGRVEIAELLLSRGARPTIFSAAMLGQLDVVKAFVAAAPGCQRILGPHSITLLSHAKAGGERAQATRTWLEQLGDADAGPKLVPLDPALRGTYTGAYTFGPTADERIDIADAAAGLTIGRPGFSARGLRHLGNHEFFPVGAEAVRVRFAVADGRATSVSVLDPDVLVTAKRSN
jgi:hypothetical protein